MDYQQFFEYLYHEKKIEPELLLLWQEEYLKQFRPVEKPFPLFALPTQKESLPLPELWEERYQILENLGEGGMGVVQKVKDVILGREIALKRLKVPNKEARFKTTRQKRMVWRLQREASITAVLEHPNIIPLYDMQKKTDGEMYFTMRKIEGGTLTDLLKKQRKMKAVFDETKILSIFLKVCDAVAYAHSKGIIHRDLKPSNIMVGKFGEVYVMDWGIAKIVGESTDLPLDINRESLFQTLQGIGTVGYMAPEQKSNATKVNHLADVYALGRILRECYTSLSPLEEFQRKVLFMEIQYQRNRQQRGMIFKDDDVEARIPADLQAIIQKATQKNPEDRYQKVQEISADLERYLKNVQVSVRDYRLRDLFQKWYYRHRRGFWIGLSAFFISGIMGLIFLWKVWTETPDLFFLAQQQIEDVAYQQPKNAFDFMTRGFLRTNSGNLEGALEDYDEAIKLHPQLVSAYYNRGVLKETLGDDDGAIIDYRTALQLDPKQSRMYFRLGQLQYRKGLYPEYSYKELERAQKNLLHFQQKILPSHRQYPLVEKMLKHLNQILSTPKKQD